MSDVTFRQAQLAKVLGHPWQPSTFTHLTDAQIDELYTIVKPLIERRNVVDMHIGLIVLAYLGASPERVRSWEAVFADSGGNRADQWP